MTHSSNLPDPGLPILQEHFRDLSRWVIGDAVGDHLTAGRCDELAEEIAVILACSLAPKLRAEIESQAEKTITAMQDGALSFDHDHQVRINGFTVRDVVKLLDAVGRLMQAGVGDALWMIHETHRNMLDNVYHDWLQKQDQQ